MNAALLDMPLQRGRVSSEFSISVPERTAGCQLAFAIFHTSVIRVAREIVKKTLVSCIETGVISAKRILIGPTSQNSAYEFGPVVR
ncbi:hypothetical protein [Mesorhizobium sp. M1142]|uniref:hypothetical protein n=1 Tax=Mesorhizobium sp. M1142 TaxID=2957060 RepID=UPI00333C4FEA